MADNETLKLCDVYLDVHARDKTSTDINRIVNNASKAKLTENKATVAGLKAELSQRKELQATVTRYKNTINTIGSLALKGGLLGAGAIGKGMTTWLQTTDPAARRFNGTLIRLKNTFTQVFANIGKTAVEKWGIEEKLQKLNQWFNKLTKADLNKFLDATKLALMVGAFAKMAVYAMNIWSYFSRLGNIKLDRAIKQKALQGTAGNALGSGLGAGVGAAVGSRAKLTGLGKLGARFAAPLSSLGVTIAQAGTNVGGPAGVGAMKFGTSLVSGAGAMFVGAQKAGMALSTFTAGSLSTVPAIGAMTLAVATLVGVFRSGADSSNRLSDSLKEGTNFLKDFGDILLMMVVTPLLFLVDAIKAVVQDIINLDFSGTSLADQNILTSGMKVALDAATRIYDRNMKPAWINPKEKKPLEKFRFAGGSETGGLADLNRMFQKMFEENVNSGLIFATDKNTASTEANTEMLRQATLAITGNLFTNGEYGKGGSGVYHDNGVNYGAFKW